MSKKIKAVKNPIGIEIDYRNYLRRYLEKVIKYARENNNRGLENATRAAIKKAEAVGGKISAHVVKEIKKNFKAGLPKTDAKEWTDRAIKESDVVRLDAFVFRNTLLIQNITSEVQLKIFEEVRKDPSGLDSLFKRIKEATGFADSRVKLIARDQTSKLNSELAALRHTAAGFSRYVWATVGDERVRENHEELNGKIYFYGEPTDEEDGLPPGEPIQCRCVAEPIFEELI
jgi:SPP1 gp7 family putative phage head morphogenesis protein